MPKVLTTRQAQQLDRYVIHQLGIPSCVLMENAGRQTAEEICRIVTSQKDSFTCVVCGCGNNGGDGLVVARYLLSYGRKVKVVVLGQAQDFKQDPMHQYQILKKLKCPVRFVRGLDTQVIRDLGRADVIVDALFGLGLSRAVQEPAKSMIEAINHAEALIISIDVPSGLDATAGKVLGVCVRADRTVTFVAMKKGFLTREGKRAAGKVKVVDIGIPAQISERLWSYA